MKSALVSAEWLKTHLDDPDIRILDASWHMPVENRDAREEYEQEHIPGALFFDVDEIANHETDLPHMLPTQEDFSHAVSSLGISNRHHIIVYDTKGIFSAPRAWWMFRVFGHENISVLSGGLPAWKAAGGEVTDFSVHYPAAQFMAKYRSDLVRTKAQVEKNLESQTEQVIDARAAARFRGEAPEPRAGLRSGHIPGSVNLPFGELLSPPYNALRTQPEVQQAFVMAGVDFQKPLVTSCGSGLTACVLALGLHELGKTNVAVYDGSWSEWGRDE